MARKNAALLPNAQVKLGKQALANIKEMERIDVPEGTEDAYRQWIEATRAVEEQSVRVDALQALVEKKGSHDPNWPAYVESLRVLQRRVSAAFGACDKWVFVRDHQHDKKLVSMEDVKATIIDSLSDKIDGLTFSVNYGLLGTKLAQAVRPLASDESAGDPTFCADCAT